VLRRPWTGGLAFAHRSARGWGRRDRRGERRPGRILEEGRQSTTECAPVAAPPLLGSACMDGGASIHALHEGTERKLQRGSTRPGHGMHVEAEVCSEQVR